MSRETRQLKKRRIQRRNLIILIVLVVITLAIAIGYYRSNQSTILKKEHYVQSINSQVYLLKDTNYIKIDNFTADNLAYPEGTKVSGYDVLTKSPMVINQEFLTDQVRDLNKLISEGVFNNWDQYSVDLRNKLGESSLLNEGDLSFYENTSEFSPDSQEELQNEINLLNSLNTGRATQITLGTFNITDTGFIYTNISEYDRLANESVLGALNIEMLNDISKLDTNPTEGFRVVNNDHCFALTDVSEETQIQGEDQVQKLKDEFGKGLNNCAYYNMLIDRVDRIREFPQLSFRINDKDYPFYLVDIIHNEGRKIMVLMIKDYLRDLMDYNKESASIHTIDIEAFIIPKSAIINKDNKTYIKILQKGYFTNEKEVNVRTYDGGNAILSVADNPDLTNGISIRIHP